MRDDNSMLVDCTMTTVPAGCAPYPVGAQWADPDVDQAATFMRRVAANRELAAMIGERGRASVAAEYSDERCASAIRSRLEEIWSAIDDGRIDLDRARSATKWTNVTPADRAVRVLTDAPQLRWNVPYRLPWPARLIRRSLHRLLRSSEGVSV
jgi:hypothetical protein